MTTSSNLSRRRQLILILTFSALYLVLPILSEKPAAIRAGCRQRLQVGGELAVRIPVAAVKQTLPLAHPLHKLAATLRAPDTGLNLK